MGSTWHQINSSLEVEVDSKNVPVAYRENNNKPSESLFGWEDIDPDLKEKSSRFVLGVFIGMLIGFATIATIGSTLSLPSIQ